MQPFPNMRESRAHKQNHAQICKCCYEWLLELNSAILKFAKIFYSNKNVENRQLTVLNSPLRFFFGTAAVRFLLDEECSAPQMKYKFLKIKSKKVHEQFAADLRIKGFHLSASVFINSSCFGGHLFQRMETFLKNSEFAPYFLCRYWKEINLSRHLCSRFRIWSKAALTNVNKITIRLEKIALIAFWSQIQRFWRRFWRLSGRLLLEKSRADLWKLLWSGFWSQNLRLRRRAQNVFNNKVWKIGACVLWIFHKWNSFVFTKNAQHHKWNSNSWK